MYQTVSLNWDLIQKCKKIAGIKKFSKKVFKKIFKNFIKKLFLAIEKK